MKLIIRRNKVTLFSVKKFSCVLRGGVISTYRTRQLLSITALYFRFEGGGTSSPFVNTQDIAIVLKVYYFNV